LKGLKAGDIDLLLVRENTEGLFAARHDSRTSDECVTDTMKITRTGAERICHLAFEEAMKRRKYVTLVDKANVLPSMVFFREVFDEVAKGYPDVKTDRFYVDAMSLYLVQDPTRFDVMVTENMFGDILSDMIAGLVGGMGFAPSGDLGENCAVFQPSHGTAPDIAGQGIANPIATILSAAMMLEWFNTDSSIEAAKRIQAAVKSALADPSNRTCELGGGCSTTEITDRIIQCL
jgi:3-isopropylmalate dehydrogenase